MRHGAVVISEMQRISSFRRRALYCIALGILVAHPALFFAAIQQEDLNQRVDSQPPPRLHITLSGLLKFLENHPADNAAESMVIKLIEIHGVSFRPTADDLVALKQANASTELLRAIAGAKMPPIPEKKNGSLAVLCEPVDCTVWLNGTAIGDTSAGVLPLTTVREGVVRVAATRRDYEADRETIEVLIHPEETTRLEFKLRPSREALIAAGTSLFKRMLGSLGAAPGLSFNALRASGTLFVDSAGKPRTAWSLVATITNDHTASFEATRGKQKYQITRTLVGFVWKKTPKTKEAQDLEGAIRIAMDEQLPFLLQRLKGPDVLMIAPDLTIGDPMVPVFRAEASWGTCVITLDAAHHPSEIEMESSGLSSGLRIRYSDYKEENSLIYPRETQVILPDRSGGVELRFDKVQVNPSEDTNLRLLSK